MNLDRMRTTLLDIEFDLEMIQHYTSKLSDMLSKYDFIEDEEGVEITKAYRNLIFSHAYDLDSHIGDYRNSIEDD